MNTEFKVGDEVAVFNSGGFGQFAHSPHKICKVARIMEGIIPNGRKITLNFAVADWEINPSVLLRYFDPDMYIVKLTPMHKTEKALENKIKTGGKD